MYIFFRQIIHYLFDAKDNLFTTNREANYKLLKRNISDGILSENKKIIAAVITKSNITLDQRN